MPGTLEPSRRVCRVSALQLSEAKKIADGIQFERLSKMWSIM
jgi:hypothetical protein